MNPNRAFTVVSPETARQAPAPFRRRRLLRWVGALGVLILVAGGVGRALLPQAVRDYVNRTLDRNPLYSGRIGDVRIHLWRGAYSIADIRVNKRTGDIPDLFFSATNMDLAIEWNALLHRRLVGRVVLHDPVINIVDSANADGVQTGAGGDWLRTIRDLFPFRINSAQVRNGSIHFRSYRNATPVDVHLTRFEGTLDNLANVRDETLPLLSTVSAAAIVMDHARLEYHMTLDPFSYRPTFHMAARMLALDVTRLNDLALAYGGFDFERGWFDFVVEADAKEGMLTGYAKPLFRDLKVFSLRKDLREGDLLQAFWEALVGATARIFRNQPREQFGTLIPFTGDLSGATSSDVLETVGNVLRNAFIRAYLPSLETGRHPGGGIQFDPPELIESLIVGDEGSG